MHENKVAASFLGVGSVDEWAAGLEDAMALSFGDVDNLATKMC